MLQYHHLATVDSTNAYLQRQQAVTDIRNRVVSADEQTAGRGMGNNAWESEARQNLTFSLALDTRFLPAGQQFLLSEAVPLGILCVLDGLLPKEKLSIKWPNDIYFETHKLGGILINSTIKANMMDTSIIGIGINVNQLEFKDWPTNPISLRQATGLTYDLEVLLKSIAESVALQIGWLKEHRSEIEQEYLRRLFRYRTWAEYEVDGHAKRLFMTGIDAFGRLRLMDEAKETLCFDVKQIKFRI